MSKRRHPLTSWKDAIPALKKLGYELKSTRKCLGHRCQTFQVGDERRTVMIRTRREEARVYLFGIPTDLTPVNIEPVKEIILFGVGEGTLYIIPAGWFTAKLQEHRGCLREYQEMLMAFIHYGRGTIRRTNINLARFAKRIPTD